MEKLPLPLLPNERNSWRKHLAKYFEMSTTMETEEVRAELLGVEEKEIMIKYKCWFR